MKLTESQYELAGKRIVDMLFLKPTATKTRVGEQALYATNWGTKTASGLAKCIERIMNEAGAEHVSGSGPGGAVETDSSNVQSLISQGR